MRLQSIKLLLLSLLGIEGFAPIRNKPLLFAPTTVQPQNSRIISSSRQINKKKHQQCPRQRGTQLYFLGTEGGILGVGAPEVALTLVVGYFVLGPSELYKLVKEIGKFVQNFRTLGAEATKSFESTMENQLELTELRKAQRELNDAFSFRRSINTDEGMEAFDETLLKGAAVEGGAGAAAAAAAVATDVGSDGTMTKKKRRLVRRKKKAAVEEQETTMENQRDLLMEYPDLDMLDTDETANGASAASNEDSSLRDQRMERLGGNSAASATTPPEEPDWFTASEEDIASKVLNQSSPNAISNPALEAYEKNRFQSQLSAEEWNKQIMDNEDNLAPLAMVMKRLAILEEEKRAADRRLEEEYQRRMDNEDRYYLEKRRILEESIEEIQEGLYGGQSKAEADGPKFT